MQLLLLVVVPTALSYYEFTAVDQMEPRRVFFERFLDDFRDAT